MAFLGPLDGAMRAKPLRRPSVKCLHPGAEGPRERQKRSVLADTYRSAKTAGRSTAFPLATTSSFPRVGAREPGIPRRSHPAVMNGVQDTRRQGEARQLMPPAAGASALMAFVSLQRSQVVSASVLLPPQDHHLHTQIHRL